MAEVDFGAWLARKYDIMQQNANTNAAEVEQRDRAATMQYGVGGVYDRSEASATKRKQMELDQDTDKFNQELPLKKQETAAKAKYMIANAVNLDSETQSNIDTIRQGRRLFPLELQAARDVIYGRGSGVAMPGLTGSSSFNEVTGGAQRLPTLRDIREKQRVYSIGERGR